MVRGYHAVAGEHGRDALEVAIEITELIQRNMGQFKDLMKP